MVLLVDEYDKPIIDHLGKGKDALKTAEDNRDVLKNFWGVVKGAETAPALPDHAEHASFCAPAASSDRTTLYFSSSPGKPDSKRLPKAAGYTDQSDSITTLGKMNTSNSSSAFILIL